MTSCHRRTAIDSYRGPSATTPTEAYTDRRDGRELHGARRPLCPRADQRFPQVVELDHWRRRHARPSRRSRPAIFHHEAELGLVIGSEAAHVNAEDAYQHIFGYVNFIDGSARGLGGNSFFQGKSWDTFGPVGPCIVTADEIDDPMDLNIRLWVNGNLRQDFSTSDMAYDIPRCIEWASGITSLEPGDILATGTNHQGLGAMQDGDVIELHIDGLDKLTINVRDDLKREWSREIDQATADFAAGRTTVRRLWQPFPGLRQLFYSSFPRKRESSGAGERTSIQVA